MSILANALDVGTACLVAGSAGLLFLTARNLGLLPGINAAPWSMRTGSFRVKDLKFPSELSPTHLSGGKLTATAAILGLANLELIARRIMGNASAKPHLFAINRGGGLLANMLLQRLDLQPQQVVRCTYLGGGKKINCEKASDVRHIILIDDVVRTGGTIQFVKNHLRGCYPDASIDAMALVVVSGEGTNPEAKKALDYAAWISPVESIQLPWSNVHDEDPMPYFDNDGMEQLVERLMEHANQFERSAAAVKVANG